MTRIRNLLRGVSLRHSVTIILLTGIGASLDCSLQTPGNQFNAGSSADFKRVLKVKSWQFHLGTDTLGYDNLGYPRFGGIALKGRLVYFIDPVCSRVNSLDLESGTVTLGKVGTLSIDSMQSEIDDIVCFAGHIVVVTIGGAFVLDPNLTASVHKTLPSLRGQAPTIHEVTPDSLVLYCDSTRIDTLQLTQTKYIQILKFDTLLRASTETLLSNTEERYRVWREDRFGKARGKHYRRSDIGNQEWMDIGSVKLEIPREFSSSINWDNVDFDESRLVFWGIDESNENYTITLLNYAQ